MKNADDRRNQFKTPQLRNTGDYEISPIERIDSKSSNFIFGDSNPIESPQMSEPKSDAKGSRKKPMSSIPFERIRSLSTKSDNMYDNIEELNRPKRSN